MHAATTNASGRLFCNAAVMRAATSPTPESAPNVCGREPGRDLSNRWPRHADERPGQPNRARAGNPVEPRHRTRGRLRRLEPRTHRRPPPDLPGRRHAHLVTRAFLIGRQQARDGDDVAGRSRSRPHAASAPRPQLPATAQHRGNDIVFMDAVVGHGRPPDRGLPSSVTRRRRARKQQRFQAGGLETELRRRSPRAKSPARRPATAAALTRLQLSDRARQIDAAQRALADVAPRRRRQAPRRLADRRHFRDGLGADGPAPDSWRCETDSGGGGRRCRRRRCARRNR